MKEWQVFAHLENCPGPEPPSKSEPSKPNAMSQISAPRQHQKTLDRLPALNYGMYKDNALRKKLQELGLSSCGPRILLEKRHKEWITLWNANCDAAKPKKRGELLSDLEMWERTQGGRANTTGRAAQNAALIKDKDFDGGAWAAKHDTSFKDLIANARKSVQAKKKTEEEKSEEKSAEHDSAMENVAVTTNGDAPVHEPMSGDITEETGSSLPNDRHYEVQPPQISGNVPDDMQGHPNTITIPVDGQPQVFTQEQLERVRTGVDPSPEQIAHWRELRNHSWELGHDEEQYKRYLAMVRYLEELGVPVAGGLSDIRSHEQQENGPQHEQEKILEPLAADTGLPLGTSNQAHGGISELPPNLQRP